LQQYVRKFREQGLGVVAISYDSVEILADFARRQGITYPMLSDPRSQIIREFGILNTSVPPDSMMAGIPYPGTYIVDQNGIVRSKYFEDRYQDRYAAPTILLREFGSSAGTREVEVQTPHLSLEYSSTRDVVHPNLRFTLVVDFILPPKMHVYSPEVKGYIPISLEVAPSPDFTLHATAYPRSELLHLPAINEIVPVYQNAFRVTRDVTMAGNDVLQPLIEAGGQLKIKGSLRYQACDDKICYLPQSIPLEWNLKVVPLERQRVPEPIQHKAPAH
jgi:hypothetical protein